MKFNTNLIYANKAEKWSREKKEVIIQFRTEIGSGRNKREPDEIETH